ncbi:hypothetical protein [Oryzomicrobium sp.]|uniref:hypothetical protein n=1 Tax=Oryzomicrobium sp. TaxID=1911578 RepID=UPI0025FCCD6E|nr:hypothetical protein [Oryzomicrobium sp.]MCE1244779.1 hypothetical protein [Oryzomicrobium sp.]
MPPLIERDGCIFDKNKLTRSHGHHNLDAAGQEAIINHIHFDESDRKAAADVLLTSWEREMKSHWPTYVFRIYVQEDLDEITIRFHRAREGMLNWFDSELDGLETKSVNV